MICLQFPFNPERIEGFIVRPYTSFLQVQPSLNNIFILHLWVCNFIVYIILCLGENKKILKCAIKDQITKYILNQGHPGCVFEPKSPIFDLRSALEE
jgi:hypothetical protein